MAQASAIKTYGVIGNREDLTNAVITVSPEKTPIWSSSGKVKASGRLHEWQTDALAAAGANAQIEGADYSFAIPAYRTRLTNNTQIFAKTLEVSGTQLVVDTAGVENEFAYQMEKRMKEIATDIEKALITGTGNTGASGTARELKGLLAFIDSNIQTGTGTATEYLTETMFNNLLQSIYAAGGDPDTAYVNAWQKRKISAFATSNTRYVDMANTATLRNFVSVYESDFGEIQIKLDQFMDTDKVLVVDSSMVRTAILRGIAPDEVAKVGDSKRGAIVGELTLEMGNDLAMGKIISLKTS